MKFGKNTYKLLGAGVLLVLILYFISVFTSGGAETTDWTENFESSSTAPYGTYLLKNSLTDVFREDSIEVKEKPLFDLLALQDHEEISYICINNQFPSEELATDELIHFVESGNHVFIAARSFSPAIEERLEFSCQTFAAAEGDSLHIQYVSNQADSSAYLFPAFGMASFSPITFEIEGYTEAEIADEPELEEIESELEKLEEEIVTELAANPNYEVLAESAEKGPVLIRFTLGKGSLILSSTPRIFSNYYMVQEDKRPFLEQAFAYLPERSELWWDEFYKINKLRFRNPQNGNSRAGITDYLFAHEGLKWAFWLSLLALAIYAAFESKRKQRRIPIVEPLPNQTLEFTETVGRLYFQSEAHKQIAEKRIRALLSYIRKRYFLKTDTFDKPFLKSLAAKSNIAEADIKLMFHSINRVRKDAEITESQLIDLNHYIDTFYKLGAR